MGAELRIGTADLPPRLAPERYFEKLSFLESALCRREVPSEKATRRWRDLAGAGRLALVSPRALTATILDPRAAKEPTLGSFAAVVTSLAPSAVVFPTPPELTPSSSGRDALRRFFAEDAPAERFAGAVRVWHPSGLWELATTARFAEELEVVVAIDPLAQDPGVDLAPAIAAHLAREHAYLRPTGLGRPGGVLTADDLDALAGLVEAVDRCWVVFAAPEAFRAARSFKKLVGATPSSEDDEEDVEAGSP